MTDDLMCPYLNKAAVCTYLNNGGDCCHHTCRRKLISSIRNDEASKNADTVIIAAVESHREGYAQGYANALRDKP